MSTHLPYKYFYFRRVPSVGTRHSERVPASRADWAPAKAPEPAPRAWEGSVFRRQCPAAARKETKAAGPSRGLLQDYARAQEGLLTVLPLPLCLLSLLEN